MFGKVILDDNSYLLYRQHDNNLIGFEQNPFKSTITKIADFSAGRLKDYRYYIAESLLLVYGKECSADKKILLNMITNYKDSLADKLRLIRCPDFKTFTFYDVIFANLVLMELI